MFTVYLGPWRRVVVLVGHEAVQEALGGQAEEFSGRGTVATLDGTFDSHGESQGELEAAGSLHSEPATIYWPVAFCAWFRVSGPVSSFVKWNDNSAYYLLLKVA